MDIAYWTPHRTLFVISVTGQLFKNGRISIILKVHDLNLNLKTAIADDNVYVCIRIWIRTFIFI